MAWGFGCRCGTCDIGYYSLWGQCHECGSQALVIFLSRAVPALGTVSGTAFFFWGGALALLRLQCCSSCAASHSHGSFLPAISTGLRAQVAISYGPPPLCRRAWQVSLVPGMRLGARHPARRGGGLCQWPSTVEHTGPAGCFNLFVRRTPLAPPLETHAHTPHAHAARAFTPMQGAAGATTAPHGRVPRASPRQAISGRIRRFP
jgi:hypothetical protein